MISGESVILSSEICRIEKEKVHRLWVPSVIS